MDGEMKHFSHDHHPLILQTEDHLYDEGRRQFVNKCHGCSMKLWGPFYSCTEQKCDYSLHKVCAELPDKMKHPMHPNHTLTLFSEPDSGSFMCNLCRKYGKEFVYKCSKCSYHIDAICASASHIITDRCHPHPLTPIQVLTAFPCHICGTTDKSGFSYKCNICPFWVHQNCTLIPDTIEYSDHDHPLKLLPSMPSEYDSVSKTCDICHKELFTYQCVYYCRRRLFFFHVSCVLPKIVGSTSMPRDQDDEINHRQRLVLLPVKRQSTDLISWFTKNYKHPEMSGSAESYIDRDSKIFKKEIMFFDHDHELFLIDDQLTDKICEACAQPISTPFYGCIGCGYFLHKCCTELPKRILHPAHPGHKIKLWPSKKIYWCTCCYQWCNGFGYKCLKCDDCWIDINCAALLGTAEHEGHKHTLIPELPSSSICSACGIVQERVCILRCKTCSFFLCFICATAPSIMMHRFDKHPFMLTYYPPEDHYNEYICELCEKDLNPKEWHYSCRHCDQFTHVYCMLNSGADSNIKYGKSYKFKDHKCKLTLISCTYDCSICSQCRFPMKFGFSVGFECIPCEHRVHFKCLSAFKD